MKTKSKETSLGGATRIPTGASLMCISGVVAEMGSLYRDARAGRTKPDVAAKLTYILREIRCALEAQTLEKLETRLIELQEMAERSQGHAVQSYARPSEFAN